MDHVLCKCQLLTWLCLSSPACWTPVELAERGLRDTGHGSSLFILSRKSVTQRGKRNCLPVTWSNATYCGAVKTPGCKGPRVPSLGDGADSTRARPRCCRRGPRSVNGGLLCTRRHTSTSEMLQGLSRGPRRLIRAGWEPFTLSCNSYGPSR